MVTYQRKCATYLSSSLSRIKRGGDVRSETFKEKTVSEKKFFRKCILLFSLIVHSLYNVSTSYLVGVQCFTKLVFEMYPV